MGSSLGPNAVSNSCIFTNVQTTRSFVRWFVRLSLHSITSVQRARRTQLHVPGCERAAPGTELLTAWRVKARANGVEEAYT
jgi:hypothetical protein